MLLMPLPELITAKPNATALDCSPGNGQRLAELAQALGIATTYGIAGDGRDLEQARQALGHVLRADPKYLSLSGGSVSLALANGLEQAEVEAATRALADGGVLVLYLQ